MPFGITAKPKREKGSPLCEHHRGKVVTYICKDCGGQLICDYCLKTTHLGHIYRPLDNVIVSNKKYEIDKWTKNAENNEMLFLKAKIKIADSLMLENRKIFPSLVERIQDHGAELKKEVDRITKKFVTVCHQLEKENQQLIHHYKNSLLKMYANLQSQILECKKTIKSGTKVEVYDVENEIQTSFELPSPPTLRSADFKLNANPSIVIAHAHGSMVVLDDHKLKPLSDPKKEQKIRTGEDENDFDTEIIPDILSKQYKLLDNTTIFGRFERTADIRSIAPVSDRAWIAYWDSKEVMQFNQHGDIKQRVKLNVEVWDISVSHISGNLWLCSRDDNSIREVNSSEVVQIQFRTAREPWCLCVTWDNRIVVGTTKQVTMYSSVGQVAHRTRQEDTGLQIITSPRCLSECPVTRNIAVADFDWESDGGEEKPHVTILDANLKFLFQYRRRPTITEYQQLGTEPAPPPKETKFNPWSIAYDTTGDLVVADFNNDAIYLISGTGSFLKELHSDYMYSPMALGLQTNNVLWTVFNYRQVRIMKYKVV